ncbi:MAG: hypothetical protein ABI780_06065 [Ardenticatenales bacterium]
MDATPFDSDPNADRATEAPDDQAAHFADGEVAAAARDAAEHAARMADAAAEHAARVADTAAEHVGDAANRVAERLEGLADDIARRIGAVLHTLPERLAAAGLKPEEIDSIRSGIESAGERAVARIEQKVAHIVARARRAAERGDAKGRHGRRWGGQVEIEHEGVFGHAGPFGPRGPFGPSGPFGPGGPFGAGARRQRAAASADSPETMTVLRMLSEGKITAEDAERLLAAMGQSSRTA